MICSALCFFGQDTGKVVMEKTQQGIEAVKDCILVIARPSRWFSDGANKQTSNPIREFSGQ